MNISEKPPEAINRKLQFADTFLRKVIWFLCGMLNHKPFCNMNKELSFNDLPKVVSELYAKVEDVEALLLQLIDSKPKSENKSQRTLLNVDQACQYLGMSKSTFYYKVERKEIPAIKQGKRYYIYQDELDAWLESSRTAKVKSQTYEEENAALLASHRRKPNLKNWECYGE